MGEAFLREQWQQSCAEARGFVRRWIMNYTLIFYVPESHLEAVKAAVFAAGAGRQGDYKNCCWQVLGQGQFQPLSGANPFIGEQGRLEQLPEWRVEMLVSQAVLDTVMQAFRAAHPYEEPAYAVLQHMAV